MLEVHTLGAFSLLTQDGCERRVRRRESGLVAFIAYNAGRWLVRDTVADMFWPKAPLQRSLHSLSQAIYRLSTSVPELVFETSANRLRLINTAVSVDALVFEHLLESRAYGKARDLYRGPFLEGICVEEAPDFSAWQEQTRARLEHLAEGMFRELLAVAESQGDWLSAEASCGALRALCPHDEDAASTHIGLLLSRGARVDARRVYDETLHALTGVGKKAGSRLARIAETLQADLTDSPSQPGLRLVGRRKELDSLKSRLMMAQSGSGAAVLVRGAAGVGKTRLCQQLLRLAAVRGFRVFQAGGTLVTREIGFAATRELTGHIRQADIERLTAPLQQALSPALTARAKVSARGDMPVDKESVTEAVTALFASVSAVSPVLLFVDDVQWLDDATGELLHFIAHRLRGEAVFVLAAARSEELQHSAAAEAFVRSPTFEILSLSELAPSAAVELINVVSETLPRPLPDTAIEKITSLARGHPFFILELAKTYGSEWRTGSTGPQQIPLMIKDFISRKLSALGADARSTADALAVLGGSATHSVLMAVAGLEENRFVHALEDLIARGFCLDTPRGPAFIHELVRECGYETMSTARRVLYHARAFKALRASGSDAATLAYHSERAENPHNAHRYASIAARGAELRFGHGEAERFWRMACAHAPTEKLKAQTLERLADCLFQLKRNAEAHSIYAQLLASGHALVEQQLLYRARQLVLAARTGMPVDDSELVMLFESANLKVDDTIKRLTILDCIFFLGMHLARDHLLNRFAPIVEQVAKEARGTPPALHLFARLAEAAAFAGDPTRAEQYASLAAKSRTRGTRDFWRVASVRALCHYLRGHAASAHEEYKAAVETCLANGYIHLSPETVGNWAVLKTELCAFDEAVRDFEDCREFCRAAGQQQALRNTEANLALVRLEMGEYDKAIVDAEAALAVQAFPLNSSIEALALGVAGLAEIETDLHAAGRRRDALLAHWPDVLLMGSDLSYPIIFLARMSEREGNTEDALERVEEGIRLYANRDFFCHARLELEKARLIGVKDPDAGLVLARAVRARALEGEATLLLNKSEALMRELKRAAQARARVGARGTFRWGSGGGG